jgi:hypothetical protein
MTFKSGQYWIIGIHVAEKWNNGNDHVPVYSDSYPNIAVSSTQFGATYADLAGQISK